MVEWVTVEEAEAEVRNIMQRMMAEGHKVRCKSLIDELSISYALAEHMAGKKSSAQAKRDGDWEHITECIHATQTPGELATLKFRLYDRIVSLPASWREPLEEEFAKRLETLKGIEP